MRLRLARGATTVVLQPFGDVAATDVCPWTKGGRDNGCALVGDGRGAVASPSRRQRLEMTADEIRGRSLKPPTRRPESRRSQRA